MIPIDKVKLGAAMAVALLVGWLWVSTARLKTALAEEKTRGVACLMANDAFAAQVEKQNKAVAHLKADAVAREKHAQKVLLAARGAAQAFLADADRIRKAKTTGDACAAANALFDAYLGSLR